MVNKYYDYLDPFNFYQGGSKGIELRAMNNVGAVYDPGVTKLLRKLLPVEKQLALSERIEGVVKDRLSKFLKP